MLFFYVKDSPSLLRYLRDNLELVFSEALENALDETGISNAAVSPSCPWTIDDLLHADLNELVQR